MSGGEGVEYPSFVRYGIIQFGRRRRRRREGRVSTLRQSRDVAVHARHTGTVAVSFDRPQKRQRCRATPRPSG